MTAIIYAAVIEWAGREDMPPELILARTEAERFERVKKAARSEYTARGSGWRDAHAILDAADAEPTLARWLPHAWELQDLPGGPAISLHEAGV